MNNKRRGRPKKVNIIKNETTDIDNNSEEFKNDENSVISELTEINSINDNDDFLDELNNINFTVPDPELEKEKEKQSKKMEKERKEFERNQKRYEKQEEKRERELKKINKNKNNNNNDDNELFSEHGTELLGREKRELISKLTQYKSLFPAELKKFKVKKNANVQELKEYLNEMEIIVNTSSVEQFITDSILHCIKLIEGGSSYTKYNIQGCSDMLNANPQFHQLSKMLYIKYKIFTAIPPEFQLLMLVSTTAYICKCRNDNNSKFQFYEENNDNQNHIII